MDITEQDLDLVSKATDFITANYQKDRHHVACALRSGDKEYLSLHLDTKGFDVCAEPIALSNALRDGRTLFDSIVAVLMSDTGETRVVAPCGNCRQILFEYMPDVSVILPNGDSLTKATARSLFPNPYE